jgi:hypothetical protein
MFSIRLGIPEIAEQWENLSTMAAKGKLGKDDEKLYKKWGKAMAQLSIDPHYPGLRSHEIEALSRRYGEKVWQSYLENSNSKAVRIYWVYGPKKGEITVIGLEPHPEDTKSSGYAKVRLSETGKESP